MEKVKEILKGYNLYTLEDIPETHKKSMKLRDVTEEQKKYGFFAVYECLEDKDYKGEKYYYVEHSYIVRVVDDLIIMLLNYKDKFYLHPFFGNLHKYQNISIYERKRKLKNLKEPNKIGVFTEKKVNDWIQYCKDYIRLMEELYDEFEDINNEIEGKIQQFIESLKDKEVTTWGDSLMQTTQVKTSLFYVTFVHYRDQKYLDTRINFRGSIDDISKLLADK